MSENSGADQTRGAATPSPVTIRPSETRAGHWAAVIGDQVVELPDDACRCGTSACRSGWPKDAPLTHPDLEAG